MVRFWATRITGMDEAGRWLRRGRSSSQRHGTPRSTFFSLLWRVRSGRSAKMPPSRTAAERENGQQYRQEMHRTPPILAGAVDYGCVAHAGETHDTSTFADRSSDDAQTPRTFGKMCLHVPGRLRRHGARSERRQSGGFQAFRSWRHSGACIGHDAAKFRYFTRLASQAEAVTMRRYQPPGYHRCFFGNSANDLAEPSNVAIDGIGQRKGATVAGPASSAARSSEDEKFELLPESVARSERPAHLEQCRRGAVSVTQLLDARMADAMRHLENKLTPETFGSVRDVLRDQASSGDDPVVAGLFRRATGKSLEA